MDKFRIDSHKLNFHIETVNSWLGGGLIAPIYVEIAPSGACNHRCVYCALDYMEYQPRFLDTGLLKKRLSEMAELGVRSVMYAGEGEPLLHKDIGDIIRHTKKIGIDIALTTNGVLLNKGFIDHTLASITWIKVSINAVKAATYARIHKTDPKDLGIVLKNLSYAVKLRKSKGYKCALGAQLLLLPENSKEVLPLAKKARALGLDYFVVKPYSHHHFSKTTRYKNIKYNSYLHLADKLNALNSDKFSAILRIQTMKKWNQGIRSYRHCLALPFWAYIDAGGNVWGCSAYLKDERFRFGNIYEKTFKEIFYGARRTKIVKMAKDTLDTSKCRVNCRMDEINRYLWELKHPPEHVNFI